MELRTLGQGHSCKLWRSNDDVLVIETPFSRVIYDSKTVEIENTRLTSTQLKGLCGNSNQDKRDETAAVTYRVQEKSCSALSQQKKIKQQQHQQEQCKKVKTQQQQQKKTVQLSQLAQKESEECNQMK